MFQWVTAVDTIVTINDIFLMFASDDLEISFANIWAKSVTMLIIEKYS
jgi:hypothetical protein